MSIADKITLLNNTTLESFNEATEADIVASFTQTGIKILNADFGFSYWKEGSSQIYNLIYKSLNMDFQPRLPRGNGYTYMAETTRQPYMDVVKKEKNSEYDFSPYMKSIIIVPIFYKNALYGDIVLCFKNETEFNEEDRGLSFSLGNAAAQAITINRLLKSEQNARVFAESQRLRFQALIENSYEIVSLLNPAGEILFISPSITKVTGYSTELIEGQNFQQFVYSEDLAVLEQHLEHAMQTKEPSGNIEFRYRHADGSFRWMEAVFINMLDDPAIGGIVTNARDITQRKLSQDTILHQALHDPLTDLPNRKELQERLEQSLALAQRHDHKLAVIFLDMDRFKKINDNLGHATGDALLKVAASRFKSCLREEDTIARFGGDEFIIVLNEVESNQDVAVVADKILNAISVPVQIGSYTLHPSVSMGISVYPYDGVDRETLKKRADIALYRAKQKGRNCYEFYDNSMEVLNSEKFALENEFRQALQKKEIILFYQPILGLKRNKIISVEALARWQHPTRELLLPDEFIPLAEENGLILELSEYILSMACQQCLVWESLGFKDFKIAVNTSIRQLAQSSFPFRVKGILEETGMDPTKLELEITESLAMTDWETAGSNLKELKRLGVRISIDDFGTGHSSLNYLKRFPINNLKIDQSFIRHCITNSQDASIVRTIVAMGHNLGLKVIAEGVETDQQLEFLNSLGCDAVQGFYIHRPMPAEDLPKWLVEFRKEKEKEIVPVL